MLWIHKQILYPSLHAVSDIRNRSLINHKTFHQHAWLTSAMLDPNYFICYMHWKKIEFSNWFVQVFILIIIHLVDLLPINHLYMVIIKRINMLKNMEYEKFLANYKIVFIMNWHETVCSTSIVTEKSNAYYCLPFYEW